MCQVVTVLWDGSPMLKPAEEAAAEVVLVHINRRPDFKLAYSEVILTTKLFSPLNPNPRP